MTNIKRFLLASVFLCSAVTAGWAAPITFTGSDGARAARAEFEQAGSNLIVTLTNTSTFDVLAAPDVLTALFFSIEGNPSLSRLAAEIAPTATILFPPLDRPATDPAPYGVGGEWTQRRSLVGAPYGANQGISSEGFGIFTVLDRFPGVNRQGPSVVDGLQYGITSLVDDPTTGNAAVTGVGGDLRNGLIKNSVVFTLGSLPVGFSLGQISNVSFQYGSSLNDPNILGRLVVPPSEVVPEPSTLVLFVIGLVTAGAVSWRKRKG